MISRVMMGLKYRQYTVCSATGNAIAASGSPGTSLARHPPRNCPHTSPSPVRFVTSATCAVMASARSSRFSSNPVSRAYAVASADAPLNPNPPLSGSSLSSSMLTGTARQRLGDTANRREVEHLAVERDFRWHGRLAHRCGHAVRHREPHAQRMHPPRVVVADDLEHARDVAWRECGDVHGWRRVRAMDVCGANVIELRGL